MSLLILIFPMSISWLSCMLKRRTQKRLVGSYIFNGPSNALGYSIDAVLITSKGEYYPFMTRLDFNCTNSVVEYEAWAIGLQVAIDKRVKELEVYDDSTLGSFISYEENGKLEILVFSSIISI